MKSLRSHSALGFALAAALAAPAQAQSVSAPEMVSPTSTPPAPAPKPAPGPGGDNAGGSAPASDSSSGSGEGIFFDDEGAAADKSDPGLHYAGATTPDVHVVRGGDTLWDLCQYYFNNPWEWPKVWSYNPTITNPHWIYPGDLVQLYPGGQGPVAAGDGGGVRPDDRVTRMASPGPPRARAATLRQIAFVDDEELKWAGAIKGSPEEKQLLAPGDEVFIEYPAGKPPQIGQRYAIYSDARRIQHPETKANVGAYVTLHGEVRITEVKKGRKARGMLTYSTDIIERGMRVGPTRTQFKQMNAVAPDRDLEGVIIGILATDDLVGENQIIFIDRGSDDGLRAGNQMRVLRRGDAYTAKAGPISNAGMDDREYPDDDIGQIMVVEVGKKSSIAFVTATAQELEIGDHVMMRKAP